MNTEIRRPGAEFLAWVWYPAVILAALVSHLAMVRQGVPILYATYVPVLFAAVTITLLEAFYPYRRGWHPTGSDILNDATFMVLVQVLLPQSLAFLIALVLVRETPFTFWPEQLPLLVQFVLMVLIADFLRYWLHVASHHYRLLWQLHAVHHSPQKLYWLNVGRFHPLEKALQFLFDTLPFVLLGIREDVLALYFVFYATNGYFQHSNVHLKMGLLNYVISSAQLHRWHHSIHSHESNRNYGNNIIVWDLLFGTYFLPHTRHVADLGLKNRNYPLSFGQQMKTPFIMRLESASLPVVSTGDILINLLLRIRFELMYLSKRAYIINASRHPRRFQLQVLERIIRENTDSGYGADHGFSAITDYQSYIDHCPVTTYEDLAPYINTDDLDQCRLTTARPVFFQVTSGTSGKPKFLPLTKRGMRVLDDIQNLVALARYLDNPGTFSGRMFAVASPAVEGHTGSGVPYGSASGLAYMNMPRLSRAKYVVPYEVFGLEDYDLKYLLLALFALAEARVTLIATANPSTMIRILEVINSRTELLLEMLGSGKLPLNSSSESVPAAITRNVSAQPRRAQQLRKIHDARGRLSYRDIWPNLQSLVTWTGGSCGIPLTALEKDLPDGINISDMGYLSSEIHATVTIRRRLGVPTFLNNFFEFVSVDDWENGDKKFKLLDELELGNRYYVIITTVNGLYRYFMNDIVEVTDFLNNTPALKFLQKGQGVTNITGEKLYEAQVLEAIRVLGQEHGFGVVFHQWLADEQESRYEVYIEPDGEVAAAEAELSRTLEHALYDLNMEYEAKRKSARLKPLQVFLLQRGTAEKFKRNRLQGNSRDGQFKAISLVYKKNHSFPLDDYITGSSS